MTTLAGALTCQRTVAENGPELVPATETESAARSAAGADPVAAAATATAIAASRRALPASGAIADRVGAVC